LLQWAVVVVYVLALFLFTRHDTSGAGYTAQLLARWFPHLSSSELRHYVWLLRKAGHVLAYGFLTVLVYYAATNTKRLRRWALPVAVAAALVVAAADESYQMRLQHRSGAWTDVFIDFLGIAAVATALWLGARIRNKHKEVVEENAEN
jgi:VanZ family protein